MVDVEWFAALAEERIANIRLVDALESLVLGWDPTGNPKVVKWGPAFRAATELLAEERSRKDAGWELHGED